MKLTRDIIILPETSDKYSDRWLVMNVHTRTCLGVQSDTLQWLGQVGVLPESQLHQQFSEHMFQIWNIGYFSHAEGLLADPSRYHRVLSQWEDMLETVDSVALLTKLKQLDLVLEDETTYRQKFQAKTSLLDYRHLGNFHQQLGQELWLKRRLSPTDWWVSQKFDLDSYSVRADNLYGGVQAAFLESYFKQRLQASMHILDIGCGIGVYSNQMAQYAADVLGIDPCKQYIEIATAHSHPHAHFQVMDIGQEGNLDAIPDQSADIIFMSDALLFYFVPVDASQAPKLEVLLSDIHRILKPNGTLISLEPHHAFYLMPWLGEISHPFTIIPEYNSKRFRITPTLEDTIQAFTKHGFVVTGLEGLKPVSHFQDVDNRAYHFAKEFPVWQLLELQKRNATQ